MARSRRVRSVSGVGPAACVLLMAAAALTKFLPALIALQFLGDRRGRGRYALALAAGLAGMLAWPLISSGPARFVNSTFDYQLWQRGGGVQFSVWTYLPQAALAARVLLALSPLLRPGRRDVRQQAALAAALLAAALLIGGQLLLGYWFYSYLTWCYPLILVAVVGAPAVTEDDARGRRRVTAAVPFAGVADGDLLESDAVVVGGTRDV